MPVPDTIRSVETQIPFNLGDDYSGLNIGGLLNKFRELMDMVEFFGIQSKRLSGVRAEMEIEFRKRFDEADVTNFKNEKISVSLSERPIVKIDTDKWDEIVKQLEADGYAGMFTKSLPGKKFQELFDGGYRLPEGVSVDTITRVGYQRKD